MNRRPLSMARPSLGTQIVWIAGSLLLAQISQATSTTVGMAIAAAALLGVELSSTRGLTPYGYPRIGNPVMEDLETDHHRRQFGDG